MSFVPGKVGFRTLRKIQQDIAAVSREYIVAWPSTALYFVWLQIVRLPERTRIADIFGDVNEDLPEEEIVRRKADAINTWVAYAWKIEPIGAQTSGGSRAIRCKMQNQLRRRSPQLRS